MLASTELYLLLGTVGAILIAYLAYRFHALTASGAVAAAVVGAVIFGLGGYVAAASLIFFFLSGSVLSHLPKKGELPLEKSSRNWKQVFANGGPPTLAVLLIHFVPSYRESGTLFFFGSLATATADTWTTEIGLRIGHQAYHIITFKPVERGLSGGVTTAGTVASLIGALVFSIIPFFLLPGDDLLCGLFLVSIVPIVASAGFIGSILDSIIGATLQVKYRTSDGRLVEQYQDGAQRITGVPIVTNDLTNLIATTWGGLLAVGLTTLY